MRREINRIIPFSSVDGPGNRTAIFLQGCNINCKYCHNPETRAHCISCMECIQACPVGALSKGADGRVVFDEEKCVQCDTCIHTCKHDSSPRTHWMTPEEVMTQVRKQMPFIRGITVSGGECSLEPDFLRELFILAKKEGLTTLIDSNGTVELKKEPELMDVTDGVMLDMKAFFEEDHQRITDHTNRIVLENAKYLGEEGKLTEVRCVIVPELYDCKKSIDAMGDYLLPLYQKKAFRIKLIEYRPMGVRKEYASMRPPTKEELDELKTILANKGFDRIHLIDTHCF